MHIRTLGRTGIKFFSVGIGTAGLGIMEHSDFLRVYVEKRVDLVDQGLGKAALTRAISGLIAMAKAQGHKSGDARIVVDTAAFYEGRLSEKMIGEVLSAVPEFCPWVLVTTKVGQTLDGGVNYGHNHLAESLLKSSELVGVEKFEVVYLHDPMGLPEETVYSARKMLEAERWANHIGVAANDPDTNEKYIASSKFSVAVVPQAVSLLNTRIERGILTHAARHNTGLVAATVIERGLLSETPPMLDKIKAGREFSAECVQHSWQIRMFCLQKGISINAAAIQWPAWRYPEVAVSVVGIQNLQQAEDLVRAAGIEIADELFRELQPMVKHFDAKRI